MDISLVALLAAATILNFNHGWEFKVGDYEISFRKVGMSGRMGTNNNGTMTIAQETTGWKKVDVPHDWALTLPIVGTNFMNGSHAIGQMFRENSIGWYRKWFEMPASADGMRIFIEFDGVYRDAQFWLNGCYLGRNESGYLGKRFEITDFVRYGADDNLLTVRVDATVQEGWWYEGAGIYRNVRLIMKDANGLVPDSTFITLKELRENEAVMHVDYETFSGGKATREFAVPHPRLWSPEDPHLYVLELCGELFTYGIRVVKFDPDQGLFINGKRVEVKGVCCHQDHAGVGVALPDALQDYRIRRLKEMGVNAYRTSHNPPTPALLDACDRHGILVMDETRLFLSSEAGLDQFSRLILRDRNHPSVIAWSIGNEEHNIQNTDMSRRIAQTMKRVQRELDPTRVTTYGGNNDANWVGVNSVVDVRGINYVRLMKEGKAGKLACGTDDYHADHLNQPIWGSEEASTLATRGCETTLTNRLTFVDADLLENRPMGWNLGAEEWTTFFAERPYLAGAFVWTGFDYRGECSEPALNCNFGVMDLCGYPKNNFWYYKARWTDDPVLQIYPHWNLPRTNLWVNTNCDEVELLVNGKSCGRFCRRPGEYRMNVPVKYVPGTVEARGVRKGVKTAFRMETTGSVAALKLKADRTCLSANGDDATVIDVIGVDVYGREVPNGCGPVCFAIEGEGRILGVGNGDPLSHEPDVCRDGQWTRNLFNGRCQLIVGSGMRPGTFKVRAWLTPAYRATVEIQMK